MGELLFSKCQRCKGPMVYDKFYGPQEHFWGWKCLICGDIIDPVILENRQLMRESKVQTSRVLRKKNAHGQDSAEPEQERTKYRPVES